MIFIIFKSKWIGKNNKTINNFARYESHVTSSHIRVTPWQCEMYAVVKVYSWSQCLFRQVVNRCRWMDGTSPVFMQTICKSCADISSHTSHIRLKGLWNSFDRVALVSEDRIFKAILKFVVELKSCFLEDLNEEDCHLLNLLRICWMSKLFFWSSFQSLDLFKF